MRDRLGGGFVCRPVRDGRVGVRVDEFDLDAFAVAAHEQKLIAFRKPLFDDDRRQRRDQVLVDGAFERPRAHFRRESFFQQKLERRGFPLDGPGAILQSAPVEQCGELLFENAAHQVSGQWPEHDDLVEPILEFRPIGLRDCAQYLVLAERVGLRRKVRVRGCDERWRRGSTSERSGNGANPRPGPRHRSTSPRRRPAETGPRSSGGISRIHRAAAPKTAACARD